MRQQEDMLAEIHALLDQQQVTMQGKLSPREAFDYIRRSRRIEELLDRRVAVVAWAEVA